MLIPFGTLASSGGVVPVTVRFAVIAGGGGSPHGKGGAGGFRKSFASELSGGGAPSESPLIIISGASVQVTVGAGASTAPANGSPSTFGTVTSLGGGAGGGTSGNNGASGASGGSGGGGGGAVPPPNSPGGGGAGTAGQGFAGGFGGTGGYNAVVVGSDEYGNYIIDYQPYRGEGGAGGGASSSGTPGNNTGGPRTPGAGLATSIRGSSETFASGNTASAPNTGNSGQSGIVIVRYPSASTINIGAGLTGTTTTVASDKVTTFTAGTGNITFS